MLRNGITLPGDKPPGTRFEKPTFVAKFKIIVNFDDVILPTFQRQNFIP
jgi:hypothetical protein